MLHANTRFHHVHMALVNTQTIPLHKMTQDTKSLPLLSETLLFFFFVHYFCVKYIVTVRSPPLCILDQDLDYAASQSPTKL